MTPVRLVAGFTLLVAAVLMIEGCATAPVYDPGLAAGVGTVIMEH